jgi:hypothetical protein
MKKEKRIKEPQIIVKPLGRFGGLDNLHITLAVVVVLLVALLLVVSYSRPILVLPANNTTSTMAPVHNAAQVRAVVEQELASYTGVNGSLSLLPYISNVSGMKLGYSSSSHDWYATVSATNPVGNVAFNVSFVISDSNLSITPFLQAAKPSQLSMNRVVSTGVVQLNGKYECTSNATRVYWFMDPYAAGSVRSLLNATALEARYGSSLNLTFKMINGPSTQDVAASVGLQDALYLSKYILCASQQPQFGAFAADLNSEYANQYMPQSSLQSLASVAGLDNATLSSCIANSTSVLNNQALLATYYNITQTPSVVVACAYMALPQTAGSAISYAGSVGYAGNSTR